MKVLLFAKQSSLKNVGGPTGYLYNISEYLKENPCAEISFLPEKRLKRTLWGNVNTAFYLFLKKVFKKSKCISTLIDLFAMSFRYEHFSKETIEYFNQFDFIHMHHAPFFVSTFLKNKVCAKLIVTSHSPEPYTNETIAMAGLDAFFNRFPRLRHYLIQKELSLYDLCDYIMFPVKEAREPYMMANDLFRLKFIEQQEKFFYVPTALNSVDKVEGNNNYLRPYVELCKNELKLCYVGRHNSVKGYDFLKKSAPIVWNKYNNVHFFIGGTEYPLAGLDDSRWRELGWVNTSLLLNEVDVFILPNKNTYFDLILLEALRQGMPIILSRTGGNKWFEQFKLQGLLFFDEGDVEGLLACVSCIKEMNEKGLLPSIKEEIMSFFKSEFSMSLYIKRYLEELNKIKNK